MDDIRNFFWVVREGTDSNRFLGDWTEAVMMEVTTSTPMVPIYLRTE